MGCAPNTHFTGYRKISPAQNKAPLGTNSAIEIYAIKPEKDILKVDSRPTRYEPDPGIKALEVPLLPKDMNFILQVLHKHFLFRTLGEQIRSQVIRNMKFFQVEPNEPIITQGEYGKYLFVIVKGSVEILVNNERINVVTRSGILGETAIICNTKRTFTAVALDSVELWGLERSLFQESLRKIAKEKYCENKKVLEKCELFDSFSSAYRSKILEIVAIQVFDNTTIVRQGELGENVYIIKSGIAECFVDEKIIKKLKESDYFGEQSLLNNSIRTATVTTKNTLVTMCIGRNDLEKVLGSSYINVVYRNSQVISMKNDKLLSQLTSKQIQLIISHTKLHKYKDKDIITKKGKSNKKIIIVIKGTVYRNDVPLSKYSCIGSELLFDIKNTNYECIAYGAVECAEISVLEIETLLNSSFTNIVRKNYLVESLNQLPLFGNINEELVAELAGSLISHQYEKDEIIFSQGSNSTELFIIKSGEATVLIDGQYVRTLIPGSIFGERGLLLNEPRSASVVSKATTQVLILTKDAFNLVINTKIRNYLATRITLQDFSIELKDLSIIKKLGKGMFGNIFLAIHRNTKVPYTLKTISNSDIKCLNIKKNIKSSQKVLLQIESPFIVKLIKTITDTERVYFIKEYVHGITLQKVITGGKPLAHSLILFYVSSMVLILKHLHSRNIVHRDIKPENILVDSQGYLKLIDFDTAKIVNDRCYTIAGTPYYMAPEIIKGNGYGLSADYWSLGIVIYELIYGHLPFGNTTEDPLEIYQETLTRKIKYRKKFAQYQELLEILLDNNPGTRADYTKVMDCSLLCDTLWDEILHRTFVPEFIPDVILEQFDELQEFSSDIISSEEKKNKRD